MDNGVLLTIKTTASAFEFLLVLFLLPSALSRNMDRNDPDYILRFLLFASLAKCAADIVYGISPGTFTPSEYACLAGALEMAVVTSWYLFTVAYLWNSWHTTAKGMRLSILWLLPWLILSSLAMANGNLHDELQGASGSKILYDILCWLAMVPMLLSVVLLTGKHENLHPRDIAILIFFPLPSVLGLLLAYFKPELLWKSPGLSLALLAVALYLQSRTSQKDPLTGAHTRSWFKAKLTERLKEVRTAPFMLLMIDLDNFKKINDTWGHLEGDNALITVVELLKKSLRNSDIIARFAGDEFLVLANISNPGECEIIMNRIKDQLMRYNVSSGKPYALGWSTGMLYCDKPRNPDELLAAVDEHMYRAKKQSRK